MEYRRQKFRSRMIRLLATGDGNRTLLHNSYSDWISSLILRHSKGIYKSIFPFAGLSFPPGHSMRIYLRAMILRGSVRSICHLENVKSYMSYLQQYKYRRQKFRSRMIRLLATGDGNRTLLLKWNLYQFDSILHRFQSGNKT
jgi:hypothetical protein